jgi:dTDP-4-dehydrorhamnose 3,5-epimerase-like enzyme
MSIAKFIDFKIYGDERGSLVSLEGNKNVPFDIKRVYYIFDNVKNVERGFHAHHNLKQVVICMHGECTFVLDDGKTREEVVLNSKTHALYIEDFIWREMKNFSVDAVLVVLASDFYDESDYIRNYEEFKRIKK